ncbi:hypothetical protein C8F01DRAFT_1075912 [Mycena amicta]|nr:hypothetical protein C8F01DRAFT_1075912 [Mycena amicta]
METVRRVTKLRIEPSKECGIISWDWKQYSGARRNPATDSLLNARCRGESRCQGNVAAPGNNSAVDEKPNAKLKLSAVLHCHPPGTKSKFPVLYGVVMAQALRREFKSDKEIHVWHLSYLHLKSVSASDAVRLLLVDTSVGAVEEYPDRMKTEWGMCDANNHGQ